MASLQLDLKNSKIFGLNYGGYEDPKVFEPYHLLLLGLDFSFNWIIDWAHTDSLAVLVIFVFQCLGLIVNLIVYVMASGSQAMQSGLRKSLIYHHQVHLITSLLYISLTIYWYIWTLRKSWPSVSDQFSFSFGQEVIMTTTSTTSTLTPNTTLFPITTLFSNLTDNGRDAMISANKSIRSFATINNMIYAKSSRKVVNETTVGKSSVREFHTLWSPGFVALYTIQRTVAIIYYFVSLKAAFLVLNASTIDSLEEKSGNLMITKSPGNGYGGRGRRISSDKTGDELQQIDTNLDLEARMNRLRNFVNNSDASASEQHVPKMRFTVSDILETERQS